MSGNDVLTVGVDIGGTRLEVGLVSGVHEVHERPKTATPRVGLHDALMTIVDLIRSFGGDPTAVGVAIAGVAHESQVPTAPNLVGWHEHVDRTADLNPRIEVAVALRNDANVGLLGEWLSGAAKGVRNVLGVCMENGIRGGLIFGGRLFSGPRGWADAIGHLVVRAEGALCKCGRRGCAIADAGRRSVRRVASSSIDRRRLTSLFEIRDEGGKAKPISKVWQRGPAEDDEMATGRFDTTAKTLGVAMGSAVNLPDVDLVVMAAGLAEKMGQRLTGLMHETFTACMLRPSHDFRFRDSALGRDAGIVGGASLGRALALAG